MQRRKDIVRTLLRPVTYLAGLLIVCVFLVLGHSVTTLNTMAKEQSRENMDMSIAALRQSLERVNIDYSWWDEAVQNLALTRNQPWIDVNLGPDALLTTGTDIVFVADDQDTIWYILSTKNRRINIEQARKDLNALFQSSRRQSPNNPLTQSGFVMLDNQLYIISVGAITNQNLESSPVPLSDTQSILGFLQEIDSNQLSGLGETLRLKDLQFSTSKQIDAGAFLKLSSPSARELGAFTWQSSKPGTDFLLKMSPLGSGVLLFVVICTLVIANRTLQLAKQLAANEQFLKEKNEKLEASLEDLAMANKQAEQASRAKTEFLANVSHELRTPLNAIIGFSEIIGEQRMGAIGNSKYVEYARDINQSGAHLLSLINEILDLSKIKSGQFRLSLENMDLNAVVESTLKLFMADADSKNITLDIECDAQDIILWADERAIRQILINLVGNALKFTPDGGTVTTKTRLGRDNQVYLSIEDTGIGIPAAEIKAAFTPFQQVDGRLNRKHGGTGLGLPLSQQLAELHGAALELKSTPEQGTKITITFPPKCFRKVKQDTQIAS